MRSARALDSRRPVALIAAAALAASIVDMRLLAALAGGIVGGVILGFVSLRHTKFEATIQDVLHPAHLHRFDRQCVFVARIIRSVTIYLAPRVAAQPVNPLSQYQRSPLTLAIFGVLIGYYLVFNLGILRASRNSVPAASKHWPISPDTCDGGCLLSVRGSRPVGRRHRGLTGVGGGSLMTPILMLLFGIFPRWLSALTSCSPTTKLPRPHRSATAGGSTGGSSGDWLPAAYRCGRRDTFVLANAPYPGGGRNHFIPRCLAVMLAVTAVGLLLQTPLQRLAIRSNAVWLPVPSAFRPAVDGCRRTAGGSRSDFDFRRCRRTRYSRTFLSVPAAPDAGPSGRDRHHARATGDDDCRRRPRDARTRQLARSGLVAARIDPGRADRIAAHDPAAGVADSRTDGDHAHYRERAHAHIARPAAPFLDFCHSGKRRNMQIHPTALIQDGARLGVDARFARMR